MKDLIILTPDKNIEFLLKGLLPRIPLIENTRAFNYTITINMYRDTGVLNNAHEFLRPFINKYRNALVVFDREGCGRDSLSREAIEAEVENNLTANGWEVEHSRTVVISPEIENWIWVHSNHLQQAISWERNEDIYEWLHQNNHKLPDNPKPTRPKEALEAVLRLIKTPRSSSIYKQIAANAGYRNCVDSAFQKLRTCLRIWFPL